jgi:hypothetical protein
MKDIHDLGKSICVPDHSGYAAIAEHLMHKNYLHILNVSKIRMVKVMIPLWQ